MATANEIAGRRQVIATAIAGELERQARAVDVEALAEAIEAALTADVPLAEGKRPEELNATNDD